MNNRKLSEMSKVNKWGCQLNTDQKMLQTGVHVALTQGPKRMLGRLDELLLFRCGRFLRGKLLMRSKMAYAGVCIGVFATGCSRDNGMAWNNALWNASVRHSLGLGRRGEKRTLEPEWFCCTYCSDSCMMFCALGGSNYHDFFVLTGSVNYGKDSVLLQSNEYPVCLHRTFFDVKDGKAAPIWGTTACCGSTFWGI